MSWSQQEAKQTMTPAHFRAAHLSASQEKRGNCLKTNQEIHKKSEKTHSTEKGLLFF